jgi:hypothetical protein
VHRLPRGLLRFQDVYVVVPEADADFSRLKLAEEPEGFVEHCSFSGGELRLTGWVVDRTRREPPREVRLLVNGEIVQALRPDGFLPRPDAGVLFPYEEVKVTGWSLAAPLAQEAATAGPAVGTVAVDVVDADGGVSRLYEDTVPGALLRSSRLDGYTLTVRVRQLQEEGDFLRARIAGMEASRFWKLRKAWFRVKRGLGLTREM